MTLFFIFLIPFLTGIIIIPFLITLPKKTNFLVDIPNGDILKIHKKNIPLSGGLAIIISVFAGFLFILEENILFKIIAISLGLILLFLLGVWDDLKWKHISTINPFLKFPLLILFSFIPALILFVSGISFSFAPISTISIMSSFVYIFIVINAINYQDGMDGLAGGLVFISLVGFTLLSLILGNNFTLIISLITLGSVFSFLVFNFPLARFFMGDSGAYSLGFILTVLAVSFSKPYNIYSVIGPIFIIGMPIIDGVFANIRRLFNGKSIFLGDRDHFYDRLLKKGLSVKKTLLISYSLQILLVVLGLTIYSYV